MTTSIDDIESRCIYLGGPGGTGKSRVIHAIKCVFEKLGKQDQLIVSATTGPAAMLIHGSTIDSLCHFRKRRSNSDENQYDLNDTGISGDVENRWTH